MRVVVRRQAPHRGETAELVAVDFEPLHLAPLALHRGPHQRFLEALDHDLHPAVADDESLRAQIVLQLVVKVFRRQLGAADADGLRADHCNPLAADPAGIVGKRRCRGLACGGEEKSGEGDAHGPMLSPAGDPAVDAPGRRH